MNLSKNKMLLCFLVGTVISYANANENLGLITVESSTIDDKNILKLNEVSSTFILTSKDIEKLNPKSVADILNTIPGLTHSITGTDTYKAHIRGIENQMYMGEKPGVAIVIDGVPVQETAGKINIDLDNIESIKVIKGGASFLYGNDAIAGAIIITTKRPKGQSFSQIETEIGSFSSKRFLASTNQSFEKSALQVQGSSRTSDGYWEDAYVREKSINGKYQYYINDLSDITFGLDLTNRKTGDGNSVTGTTMAETNPTSAGVYSYGGYYHSDLIKTFITYSEEIDQSSHYMLRFHKYIDDKTSKTNRTAYNNIENGIKMESRVSTTNHLINMLSWLV